MRWLLSGIVVLPLSAALAQAGQERLVAPALPGFVVGHTAANAQQSILEEVPRGETVHAWTRMVTTQRFGGVARSLTLDGFAANVRSGLMNSCAGARLSAIERLKVSAHPAIRFQADCPRNPAAGGRPESFIMLAVMSPGGDLLVKQVAWRGGTTPQGLAWGRGFLAGVGLCAAADRTPRCR